MRSGGTLTASNMTKSHGPQLVLADVTLVVPPRSRIGLVGPNGVGKSTLLRLLAGLEEPDRGRVRRSPPTVTVGYLAQEPAAAALSGGETARGALESIQRSRFDVLLLDEPTNNLDFAVRDLLERFVHSTPGSIVVVSRGVNCLVLDEPTNHLDVAAIEELESALERFDGAVLLVSHDRRFLESAGATRTLELPPSPARAAGAGRR